MTPCPPDQEEHLEINEDVRRFLTSPADLDLSGGRRISPHISLAKCGDGITYGAQRGAHAYPSGSHNGCFTYADKYGSVINNIPVLSQAQYFAEAVQPLQHHQGWHHASNKSSGALSNEIRHFDAPSETELSGRQPMSNSVMVPTGRHSVWPHVSYCMTQPLMTEFELAVGGLQKQTVNNCGSVATDPVLIELNKQRILDDEIHYMKEQFKHMRGLRHGRFMKPRALSLNEICRPMELFSQNVSCMESVERGRASAHVETKIAGNFTSGAHESIGNVIDQRAGRPSASTLGPNECLALQDKHAHGRQSAFSYTSGRNADGVSHGGHANKGSECGSRGRSRYRCQRVTIGDDGDNSTSPSS